MWRDSFNLSELDFLAENELIQIIPNFRKEEINLLSGTYGPFKPNKTINVPLWYAMQLYKNKKCKIIIPSYLESNFLELKLKEEKDSYGVLVQLPDYFFEVSQILFNNAPDEFFDLKLTQNFVEDLTMIRTEKINKILENIKTKDLSLKLEGFNQKEIEQVRPILSKIFPMKLSILNPSNVGPTENNLFANVGQANANNNH